MMRIMLRLKWPADRPMVVECDPDFEFLNRAWRLTRICEKIRRTMGGPGRVTIENAKGDYIALNSEAGVRRLLAMAKAKEWREVQWLFVPENLRVDGCLVLAGMRSRTMVDERGVWFEGTDGTKQYVSVRLEREWLSQELKRRQAQVSK